MNKAVIVSATRTPLGSFGGTLSKIGATDLGAHVIRQAITRAGINDKDINECIMGMVLPCGYGQNPGKIAAVKAGLPWEVESITVNKVCGSSLKAVMLAAQAIQCGDADVVVAGGMENMSMAPYYMDKARWGHRMGPGRIEDHMVHDGLWDVINDFHMGMSNELCSEKWDISRQVQDEFAARSYERANASIARGRFKDEIVPVQIPQRKGDPKIFDTDECPKETTYEFLSKMRPAFKKDGTVTAGNASGINDAAAALLVMSEAKAKELGLKPLVKIRAYSSAAIDPAYMGLGPIPAVRKILDRENLERLSEILKLFNLLVLFLEFLLTKYLQISLTLLLKKKLVK